MKQLSYEQEVQVLAFIEYCQGNSTKGDCRGKMYDIYQMFKSDGRNSSVCTCLDGDTAKKVDNFITAYTFSDEIRFTERFHKLLPHLALIEESAKEPLEEKSTTDLSEGMDKFIKKAKKPKRKRITKKKK
jgi:hypothetical protein